ncbi:MAG: HDOD domain-containing protein, partial [Caldimonas sp.]
MSLARWWDRLARRRRSGATTTEPPAAGHPRVAAAATPPPTVATTAPGAARSPEAATETSALPDELDAKDDAGAEADKARRVRFFCWLVGVPAAPGADAVPSAVIPSLLERLDQVIASESLRAGLLPRAPHVVPQLMKTLRDEHYSSVDVANRIAKDVVLTAEVVRSATSAFRQGEDDGEIDLARAVAMIGTQGLRRAIANVVLRPIFDA